MSGKKSRHCRDRNCAIRREHYRRTRYGIDGKDPDGQPVKVKQKSYEAVRDMVAWVLENWGDDLEGRTIENIIYRGKEGSNGDKF